MKLAEALRERMRALLYLFDSHLLGAKSLGCCFRVGGSIRVERRNKGRVFLSLRVNRQTAYGCETGASEVLEYWWETFGKMFEGIES